MSAGRSGGASSRRVVPGGPNFASISLSTSVFDVSSRRAGPRCAQRSRARTTTILPAHPRAPAFRRPALDLDEVAYLSKVELGLLLVGDTLDLDERGVDALVTLSDRKSVV